MRYLDIAGGGLPLPKMLPVIRHRTDTRCRKQLIFGSAYRRKVSLLVMQEVLPVF